MKSLLAAALVVGSALAATAADVDANLGTLPPGKTVTIRFRANVNGTLPAGVETVQNQGSVSGANLATVDTDDPDVGGTADPTSTNVFAVPDLSITKTDGVAAATAGGTLTYTLATSNVGNQDATGVTIFETVPTGATYVATGSSAWSCADGSPGGTTCAHIIGSVAATTTAVRTFIVRVDNPLPVGLASVVNTASVVDDNTNGTDPNGGNNQYTDTDTLGTNLQMALADAPDPVTPGNSITYTITATNAGPNAAANAALTTSVPPGLSFMSLASAAGWSCTTPAVGASGAVTCTNASMAAGPAVFALAVGVSPAATNGTTLSQTASITSTTLETSPGDESATANTLVQVSNTAPAPPTQAGPSSTINTGSPTFTWTPVAGAEEYRLWVGSFSVNMLVETWTAAYAAGCTTVCTLTPPGLSLPNGTYTWWVQGRNDAGNGGWSAGQSFTVNVTLPGALTLIAPSGLVTSTASPTYQWTLATGATEYQLYVNDMTGGIAINTAVPASGCAPGCARTATALPDGVYELWMRSKNSAGYGPWAGPLAFTIDVGPDTPTVTAPTGTVTTLRPAYVWNAVSGAVDYQVYVSDATAPVLQVWYPAATYCAGATCTLPSPVNLQNGAHQVWVRARNAAATSAWSVPRSFMVNALPPAAPTLLAPTGNVSSPTPRFSWQASAGATDYKLWVNTPTSSIVTLQWYTASAACVAGTCSATPSTTLYNGTNQYWVQAKNCSGASGWGPGGTFMETGGTVLPVPGAMSTAPVATSPTGTITATSTPSFTWTDVAALDYQVIAYNPAGPVGQWRFSNRLACSSGTCTASPLTPMMNGTYNWSVQPMNQVSGGPTSTIVPFTLSSTALNATLVSPTGPAGTNTPTFTWTAAPAATEYYLWVQIGGGVVYSSWFASADVCTGSNCSVNPQHVFGTGTYSSFIRARDCTDFGPWSPPMSFVTP